MELRAKIAESTSEHAKYPRVRNMDTAHSEQFIYNKIYQAIIEQRLLAGTKLGEKALCNVFNVSRSRIRNVLLTLSNRNVVELRKNKGAFVATPAPQEARHVFEARRSIESTIITRVVERTDDEGIRKLQSNIEEEHQHIRSGNRHDAIRLSGEFHLCLAEISANQVLYRFLKELVPRTSLMIGMFGNSMNLAGSGSTHQKILQAIIDRDSLEARRLMDEHLNDIEISINMSKYAKDKVDLKKLFAVG